MKEILNEEEIERLKSKLKEVSTESVNLTIPEGKEITLGMAKEMIDVCSVLKEVGVLDDVASILGEDRTVAIEGGFETLKDSVIIKMKDTEAGEKLFQSDEFVGRLSSLPIRVDYAIDDVFPIDVFNWVITK